MSRNSSKRIVAVICGVACAILLSVKCCGSGANSNRRMSAQAAVVHFSDALVAYYREYGIVDGRDGAEEGCCTVEELVRKYNLVGTPPGGRNPNGTVFVDFSRPVIDRWAQPYYAVYWAEELQGTNCVSVFVWSFGPNRINEIGRGDDIYIVKVVGFDEKSKYRSEKNYLSYPSGMSCLGRVK